MANNLKMLRKRAGLTQDDLAAKMNTTGNQLVKLEGGSRRLSDVWIDRASSALRVDPGELVTEAECPVIGIAGAGPSGEVSYSDSPGTLGFVMMPPGGNDKTAALEVRGVSMRGIAEDGWYVYYDDRREELSSDLIGELCVVGLDDGRTLVKTPHRSREPGLYDLESTNAPTLRGVAVRWAALVTAIVPGRVARQREF